MEGGHQYGIIKHADNFSWHQAVYRRRWMVL